MEVLQPLFHDVGQTINNIFLTKMQHKKLCSLVVNVMVMVIRPS